MTDKKTAWTPTEHNVYKATIYGQTCSVFRVMDTTTWRYDVNGQVSEQIESCEAAQEAGEIHTRQIAEREYTADIIKYGYHFFAIDDLPDNWQYTVLRKMESLSFDLRLNCMKAIDVKTALMLCGLLATDELEKLWEAFSDIPIDEQENIEESFLHFPAGTPRMDIWHCFDEKHPTGVYSLCFPNVFNQTNKPGLRKSDHTKG